MRHLQTHKDLPVQLLLSSKPLKGSVVIASFGSAQGLETPVFDVDIKLDPNVPPPKYEKPVRYGKKDEINHIFRPDARSPPKVISLFFVLAVLSTLPVLFISVSAIRLFDTLHFVLRGCMFVSAYVNITPTVACAWCQCLPPHQSFQRCAAFARFLLQFHHRDGVRFLPVLYQLEPVPDPSRHGPRRSGCVP